MKINNLCIVFGADHFNPLGIVRSLGEKNIRPVVVLTGDNTYLIPASIYPRTIHHVKTNEEGLLLIKRLYSNEKEKVFILTGSDDTTALLNEHYDELKDKFYFYNCGERGRLNSYFDKNVMNDIAKSCGIKVAKSEIVKTGELPKQHFSYPVITKAVNSLVDGWKKNTFLCYTEEDLLAAYEKIEDDKVLIQEYIVKKDELCIDGVVVNKGNDIYMPINSYYYRLSNLSYGYFYYFTKFNKPELLLKIEELFKKVGFEGIFTIEFLVDKNDDLYFLEVNFRNSAWSHASTRAGYNVVYTWMKSMINGCIDRDSVKIGKLPFSCMVELSEFRKNVLQGNISLFQFLKDLYKCDYLTYWDRRDNGPFWAEVKWMIKRFLKKLK